jgi:hypothetical protein
MSKQPGHGQKKPLAICDGGMAESHNKLGFTSRGAEKDRILALAGGSSDNGRPLTPTYFADFTNQVGRQANHVFLRHAHLMDRDHTENPLTAGLMSKKITREIEHLGGKKSWGKLPRKENLVRQCKTKREAAEKKAYKYGGCARIPEVNMDNLILTPIKAGKGKAETRLAVGVLVAENIHVTVPDFFMGKEGVDSAAASAFQAAIGHVSKENPVIWVDCADARFLKGKRVPFIQQVFSEKEAIAPMDHGSRVHDYDHEHGFSYKTSHLKEGGVIVYTPRGTLGHFLSVDPVKNPLVWQHHAVSQLSNMVAMCAAICELKKAHPYATIWFQGAAGECAKGPGDDAAVLAAIYTLVESFYFPELYSQYGGESTYHNPDLNGVVSLFHQVSSNFGPLRCLEAIPALLLGMAEDQSKIQGFVTQQSHAKASLHNVVELSWHLGTFFSNTPDDVYKHPISVLKSIVGFAKRYITSGYENASLQIKLQKKLAELDQREATNSEELIEARKNYEIQALELSAKQTELLESARKVKEVERNMQSLSMRLSAQEQEAMKKERQAEEWKQTLSGRDEKIQQADAKWRRQQQEMLKLKAKVNEVEMRYKQQELKLEQEQGQTKLIQQELADRRESRDAERIRFGAEKDCLTAKSEGVVNDVSTQLMQVQGDAQILRGELFVSESARAELEDQVKDLIGSNQNLKDSHESEIAKNLGPLQQKNARLADEIASLRHNLDRSRGADALQKQQVSSLRDKLSSAGHLIKKLQGERKKYMLSKPAQVILSILIMLITGLVPAALGGLIQFACTRKKGQPSSGRFLLCTESRPDLAGPESGIALLAR